MTEELVVSLDEAAKLLDMSSRTVLRRLKDGTLKGRKHAGKWLVTIPGNITETEREEDQVTNMTLRAQVSWLSSKVDSLTNNAAELAREKSELEQKTSELHRQIEELTKQLTEVMQDKDTLARDLAESARQIEGLKEDKGYLQQALAAALGTQRLLAERATASQGKRPWWRFWQRDEEGKRENQP